MRATPRRFAPALLGAIVVLAAAWPGAVAASSTTLIPTGYTTGAIAFDPARGVAYVGGYGSLTVVDSTTHAILEAVPVGGPVMDIVVDPVSGDAFFTTNQLRVEVLDATTRTLETPITITPTPPTTDGGVTHLAFSASRSELFVFGSQTGYHRGNELYTIDVAARTVRPDANHLIEPYVYDLAFDDTTDRLFAAASVFNEPTQTVLAIDPDDYSVLATFDGGPAATSVAFDAGRTRLYVTAGQAATAGVTIIDTSTDTVVGTLNSTYPNSIAVDPARDRQFVTTRNLAIFDGGALSATVPFRTPPGLVAVDPTTGDPWLQAVGGSEADQGIWVVDLDDDVGPQSGFLTSSGGDLFLDGRPYTFTGVNIYNANSDGWCRGAIDDQTLEDAIVNRVGLAWVGHGVIRAWFFQPLATSYPSGARDWSRFDRLLALAAANGYKVIPTLADQWGECGARVTPTYGYKTEAWYEGGYQAPDPGMTAAYAQPWKSYRDWVEEVVTRYKDDPTIAFWQLMNEAEVNPGGAFGACPPGNGPRDTLIDFATEMSGRVKAIDHNHLLSLGTIGSGQCGSQGSQYQDVHAIPDIDLCEFHDYTPNQSIPGDQWNGLGVRVQQCAALGKPLFVGEAGIRPIDVGGSLIDRAAAVRAKTFAQLNLGIDGLVLWNFWTGGSTLDNYDLGPGDPALYELYLASSKNLRYVVNTTNDVDDGTCDAAHCSLREAMSAAGRFGPDGQYPYVVAFDIPGPGPHRIAPTSPLPDIPGYVMIDGTSQPGFAAGVPVIEITGVDGPIGDGLHITGPDATVRGLVINGFGGASIRLTGGGSSLIVGNRLGTNVAGTAAVPHPGGRADSGILIEGGGNHQIGGATGGDPNLISGNDVGIRTIGVTSDVVITQNVITGNDEFGIDLGDNGVFGLPVTNVDYQNAPIINSVDADLDTVSGVASGLVGPIHVELFASSSCPRLNAGVGERFLGSVDVNAAGTPPHATFEFTAPSWNGVGPDDVITATATSSAGTSEFSGCVPFAVPGGDTPVGDAVVVQPVDESTGEAPVLIGFETVTGGGVTTLTTSDTAPPLPTGFQLGDPPTYFDISTTATYTGQVALCFDYSGFSYIDPASVRLYHYDAGLAAWQDVTESNDTDAHQICGSVTSLSPFALVQVTPTFTSSATATFTAGTSGSKSITTSGFVHPTLTATGDVPAGLTLVDAGNGTAMLSGTPAAGTGGVHAVILHGVEAGVEITQSLQVTVDEAPAFTSPNAASFTIGTASTFQIVLAGHPTPTLTKNGSLPSGLTFNAAARTVSGTPAAGTAGTYKLNLQASNGIGSTAKQTMTITVGKRSTATAVTCTPDPSAPANKTTCRATISDTGGSGATTPTGSATWTVVTGSGSFSGASCANQAGARVCTVTFTPGLTQTVDQRVKATYGGDTNHTGSAGEAPVRLLVAAADAYNATVNTTLTVAAPGVLANDRNTAGGTVALVGGPAHGTLTLAANGSFTYKPAKNYKGKDAFIYRFKVGGVWSLPTVVTITIR